MVILSQPDMDPPIHVRDSIKQIDKTSPRGSSEASTSSVTSKGRVGRTACGRTAATAHTIPSLHAGPLAPDGHARQIHDAGDVSAVFSFSDALIIEVRISNDNTRREPETLAFDIPTVLFYTEDAGKTYLVEPCAPGKRLNEAWWKMPEEEKEHVVTRVSEICAEIKVFRSSDLTGVDYN
ncbi:hypothetical protein TOPH_09213 [Tolypocladium ophioglossoides CBS 100239]|uniref:Uncharacterized protein n=1 Tax=Tolypocladium ophioglossoides (strain CBS 100239) TaxID=1163406 RepID=A0A0L0MW60_TOLOC|nr:hypothetical protein TOPH_09213 [Tolypocladium ophioglossoides CBS 100239]